ncbi:hypothetical protein AQJ23_14155 [Streptomyces antibioticus]|nr:hypothetical protein [Streptomyces antibioticus]KUN26314.1 hypothetical protein AQJ23_14155 [Streptomyces antibioticus]
MISSAALPGAALRMLRTAAGRRALQVVVLVGGLFALGFLCGERASAAEGVPTVTSHEVASVVPVVPVTSGVPVDGGKAVQPVGDLVEMATEHLTEVQAQAQAQTHLPSLPAIPAVPEFPVPPEVPGLPGQTLPAPVTATPQPGSPADDSTGGHGSADSRSPRSSHKARAARVSDEYGPSSGDASGSPVRGTAAKADRHRAAKPVGYVPTYPAPAGDLGGAVANRPGVDNGSPRHGDAQAVSLNDRAPLRLVPGGVVRTDADGTRDRHRDIPVSPA